MELLERRLRPKGKLGDPATFHTLRWGWGASEIQRLRQNLSLCTTVRPNKERAGCVNTRSDLCRISTEPRAPTTMNGSLGMEGSRTESDAKMAVFEQNQLCQVNLFCNRQGESEHLLLVESA